MTFELDQGLVEALIYGMENQEVGHVLDARTLKVLPEDEVDPDAADEEGRLVPLPEWRPVDGFRLMESFVASLRNPMFREELRAILQSGRGVFRQFKDALKQRPDMERLWFSWKQREMRRHIYEWYNGLREVWGLSPLAWEDNPEQDTADLVLWDFEFRLLQDAELGDLEHIDRSFFDEAYAGLSAHELTALYERLRCGIPRPGADPESAVMGVFAPDGGMAGFMWYRLGPSFGELVQLGVLAEYRGLGIARTFLRNFTRLVKAEAARRSGEYPVWCLFPQSASFLERHVGAGTDTGLLKGLRSLASPPD